MYDAAIASCRADLALKLRAARRKDAQLAALNQVKQSMAAPDWELDDFEWCALHDAPLSKFNLL